MQNQRELVTKMKFGLHSKHMSRIMNVLQEHMLFIHKINSLESKQKKTLISSLLCRALKVSEMKRNVPKLRFI